MVVRVATVAFEGIEARPVDVQVQIASGNVFFGIVGLGDKAVAESKERVRAALFASGLALPAKRIIVNLAPADLPKEGSHYDLPIALGIMAAIGALPADMMRFVLDTAQHGRNGKLILTTKEIDFSVAGGRTPAGGCTELLNSIRKRVGGHLQPQEDGNAVACNAGFVDTEIGCFTEAGGMMQRRKVR